MGKHTAGFSVPWGFGMHPHPRVRGCGCSHLPVCDGELWTSPPRAPRARGDPRPASSRGIWNNGKRGPRTLQNLGSRAETLKDAHVVLLGKQAFFHSEQISLLSLNMLYVAI